MKPFSEGFNDCQSLINVTVTQKCYNSDDSTLSDIHYMPRCKFNSPKLIPRAPHIDQFLSSS